LLPANDDVNWNTVYENDGWYYVCYDNWVYYYLDNGWYWDIFGGICMVRFFFDET
jgi:hypothetical protein